MKKFLKKAKNKVKKVAKSKLIKGIAKGVKTVNQFVPIPYYDQINQASKVVSNIVKKKKGHSGTTGESENPEPSPPLQPYQPRPPYQPSPPLQPYQPSPPLQPYQPPQPHSPPQPPQPYQPNSPPQPLPPYQPQQNQGQTHHIVIPPRPGQQGPHQIVISITL